MLVMALEELHGQTKVLGLQVSRHKTKVHVFEGLPDDTVHSVHAFGEYIEICDSFACLGGVMHKRGTSCQEVSQRVGLTCGVMDLLIISLWSC